MTTNSKPNRLAKEKSPYLLQHAHNHVAWFPWSEEAFETARRENKPIFLSIGYSTCHWCHVMERESFADEEVAELLNREYVAVKVDREERPDVDHLYMTVCQTMTGQGGWPLTIVMTPEGKPFFAGTYFPKQSKFGRLGLLDILPQLAAKWKEHRHLVMQAGEEIAKHTESRLLTQYKGQLSESSLDEAFVMFEEQFDSEYGGFGDAPKFPAPHQLLFLMRYYAETEEDEALAMVETTLEAMYRGGIFDHIGFGFARYSTDRKWLVPHFEKMLYDNALLAYAYTEAYQLTGKPLYRMVAELTLAYVLRDMKAPDGGFYSAEDADSDGEEGKFYVWTPEEVAEALGEEDGTWFCERVGITAEGNFNGRSIPNLLHGTWTEQGERSGEDDQSFMERAEMLRRELFMHREKRTPPGKDDKVLTSWNGLMIAALAKAAAVFDRPEYAEAALQAEKFLFQKLRTPEGRLLARYRDGEAAIPGFLDDYAFLLWGLIELYQATFDDNLLQRAKELVQDAVCLFWDEEHGGFFFTGNDAEELFSRMKIVHDSDLPSGNAVMANNLLRLARLMGEQELASYAEQTFIAFAGALNRHPMGHSMMLSALIAAFGPSQEIVIAGRKDSQDTKALLRAVRKKFLPHAVVLLNDPDREALPHLANYTLADGAATAYVCKHFACQAPVTSADELLKKL